MNFIKLTKMDDNFNKNVLSPLAHHIESLFPILRAIGSTFPTNILHNAPKSVNSHHSYICRVRLKPVFQRTRTYLPNYTAFRIAGISPIGGACSQPLFLSHLRTLAYWMHSGGAL
jgi:hypothetical protein